ncbi:class I SAM-dependent methyltransferase [Prosthecochloris sp. SCSIO W1103]|uniref:class I SAM-dependent methyltransferase n=1 Tax=Prosthecochloris sp. SCSIO W1103 TaxID=2992244 RepID=UPI00223D5CB3|nr:class I SAM-dependent methyltransferase [Prosthecochloris sp. SCSIO W1103]UZJ36505.1 methyltransferase domain-containing protein [Prosthecochloris sp. SCSIO W1103]
MSPKIEQFEKYSDAYDSWFEDNPDFYEAELETVRQMLPENATEGVEIGVGSGKFADPLGIRVGVEPSDKMASKAIDRGIDVCRGVAEALPFSGSRFDFVLMVTTICFVDDVLKSFKEAFRVLKPSGFIIVGFVDKQSKLGKEYARKKNESKFYGNAEFFSVQEVVNYLETAGFRTVKIRQTLIPGELPGVIQNGFGSGAFVVIKGRKIKKIP